MSDVIYKSLLSYRGDDCEAFLFKDRITWENISNPTKRGVAKFSLIYGVLSKNISKNRLGFCIYGLQKKKSKYSNVEISFICPSENEVNQWVSNINDLLKQNWYCPLPRKPVYIIVNPFSGKKKAIKLYNTIVKPMLDSANLEHVKIETEKAGHACEIASNIDISQWSAIATISGDGLLHEVLQGLMNRPDWQEAIKIPLGLLPAGSGNGLMKSFDCVGILSGVFNLIKGYTRPLDILSLSFNADTKNEYCHLATFWGLLADADIESDRYRWFGPARFTVGAVVRMVNLRTYHGILRYLPLDNNKDDNNIRNIQGHKKECPENWKEIETDFVLFCAANTSWISTDVCIAPNANHKDGYVDIVWVEKGITKSDLAKLLLQVETGEHINHSAVHYEKVKSFSLIPTTSGIIDLDGEPLPSQPFTCEVLPSLVNLLTPKEEEEED